MTEQKTTDKNVLISFAMSVRAKELLKEFLQEKSITEKATALGGVCRLVKDKKGHAEISKFLDGTHQLLMQVPLQTLERFWMKHIKEFGLKKLKVKGKTVTMVKADIILSQVQERLYFIHARVVSGE